MKRQKIQTHSSHTLYCLMTDFPYCPLTISLLLFILFYPPLLTYIIWCEANSSALHLLPPHVYKPVKLSWDHHLLRRFLVALVSLSLCSTYLLNIIPVSTKPTYLDSNCMTTYFPAPHNEERDEFVYSIYQLIHQNQFGLVFI